MRSFYSVLTACGVSFLLFSLMQFLVSGGRVGLLDIPSGSTMQFIRLQNQSATQLKQRQLPKKPEPPNKTPAKPVSIQKNIGQRPIAKPRLSMPGVPVMAFNNRPFLGGFNSMSMDNDLLPLVRVEPNYPRKAARSGTEGWVEVKFTVLEDGSVSAAKVIKSEPRRVFNREALRAIAKWKFNPKMVDGKPVKQTATQVIQFKLAKP
jgi:protein TonB